MSEWQPIETAPHDGTPVLVFSPGNVQWVGTWMPRTWQDDGAGDWEGYYGGTSPRDPTHWMPLPEPPK